MGQERPGVRRAGGRRDDRRPLDAAAHPRRLRRASASPPAAPTCSTTPATSRPTVATRSSATAPSPPARCPSALACALGRRAARRRRRSSAFVTARDFGITLLAYLALTTAYTLLAQAPPGARHRRRGRRLRAAGHRRGGRHRHPDLRVVLHRHQLRGAAHGGRQARRRAAPSSGRTRPSTSARRSPPTPRLPRLPAGRVLRRSCSSPTACGPSSRPTANGPTARSGTSCRSCRSPSPSSATPCCSTGQGRAREARPLRPHAPRLRRRLGHHLRLCRLPPPEPAAVLARPDTAPSCSGLGPNRPDRRRRAPPDLRRSSSDGRSPTPRPAGCIARGLGRGYGDAPRTAAARVVETTGVDAFTIHEADPPTTVLVTAEAGASIDRLLHAARAPGLLRAGHPRHPLRHGRRGHRGRHPRQEPPHRAAAGASTSRRCGSSSPAARSSRSAPTATPTCSGPPPAAWASPAWCSTPRSAARASRSSRLLGRHRPGRTTSTRCMDLHGDGRPRLRLLGGLDRPHGRAARDWAARCSPAGGSPPPRSVDPPTGDDPLAYRAGDPRHRPAVRARRACSTG